MNKKQYIFISTGYMGGASRFIYDHLNYLSKRKKKTILIDDQPFKTYSKIPKKTIVKKIKLSKYNIDSNKKLRDLLLNNSCRKIVFLTNYAFLIRYFSLISQLKKKKIKIILTIHSGLFDLSLKRYLAGLFFSFVYKKVDYLYFGSNSAKNWWLKFYPWMNIKTNPVYYNGVEIQKKDKINKIKKKKSVSFVGRLEKENNPEFFLNIAKDYLRYNNNVVFNVYGDGSMYTYLKSISKGNKIKFYGWQKKEKIYKNSDIVIITSKINNFPYVALEAKSFGIPVISCSKGDVKRIIKNNFDGYISYTESTEIIINLINKILKKYNKFSRNSVHRSKLFEVNNACKKFWKNIV